MTQQMAKITYIEHDGREHVVEVSKGMSLMEGAIHNDIEGIEAECGGCCSCATCHVYVDKAWVNRLPPVGENEDAMLEGTAADRLPNSRLSCQIPITDELDGLVVRLPEFQT